MRLVVLMLGATVLVTAPSTATTSRCGWSTPRTSPTIPFKPVGWASVAAPSAANVWAVGLQTNPLQFTLTAPVTMHWNGRKAAVFYTSLSWGSGLAAVAALGREAWAVGAGGRRAITLHWQGRKWAVVRNPGGSGSSLFGVAMVSRKDVWAVGSSRTGGLVLRWNGSRWTKRPQPGFDGPLSAVARIPGTSQIWVGGSDSSSPTGFAVARWTGSGWTKFALPGKAGAQGYSQTTGSLTASSASSAWAVLTLTNSVGRNRTDVIHWDGSTWSQVQSPNPSAAGDWLSGVTARSDTDAWAVGGFGKPGNKAHALVLHWNGSKWSTTRTPGLQLHGVAAAPGTRQVWVAGAKLQRYRC
jgi:hypothetical protein